MALLEEGQVKDTLLALLAILLPGGFGLWLLYFTVRRIAHLFEREEYVSQSAIAKAEAEQRVRRDELETVSDTEQARRIAERGKPKVIRGRWNAQ